MPSQAEGADDADQDVADVHHEHPVNLQASMSPTTRRAGASDETE
jgi:hypothetical protein